MIPINLLCIATKVIIKLKVFAIWLFSLSDISLNVLAKIDNTCRTELALMMKL